MPELKEMAWYAFVGATGFVFGAFLQQETSIKNLFDAIKRDPYVYLNRQKLYPVLSTFSTDHEARLWNRPVVLKDKICDLIKPLLKYLLPEPEEWQVAEAVPVEEAPMANMLELLKYGLPSADNVLVHKDHIVSRGRQANTALWICEHFRAGSSPVEPEYLRYRDVFLLSGASADIGQVFKRPVWQELERYLALKTQECGSVYAYTGPIFTPTTHGTDKCWLECREYGDTTTPVPSHYFKVLIIEEEYPLPDGAVRPPPVIEAYVVENDPYADTDTDTVGKLGDYRVPIEDVEEQTGLLFNKDQLGPKLIPNNGKVGIDFTLRRICETTVSMLTP